MSAYTIIVTWDCEGADEGRSAALWELRATLADARKAWEYMKRHQAQWRPVVFAWPLAWWRGPRKTDARFKRLVKLSRLASRFEQRQPERVRGLGAEIARAAARQR